MGGVCAALVYIQHEGELDAGIDFGRTEAVFVALELDAKDGWQLEQAQLLGGSCALLAVAASVRGLGQLFWGAVPQQTSMECLCRGLDALFLFLGVVALFFRLVRVSGSVYLQADVQERLVGVGGELARLTRYAALQDPAEGAVNDAGAHGDVIHGRLGHGCVVVGVLAEQLEMAVVRPWAGGQLGAFEGVGRQGVVDAVESADEHFVSVVLPCLGQFGGRHVHPNGEEEGRGSVRALRVGRAEELFVQLVHLAGQAVAAERAERSVVPVAQEVVAEEGVVQEGLQDHVEEAGGAHVAQAAGHAAHAWEGLAVGRAGVVHAELVECVFLDAGHARAACLALPDVLEAWVVHDVVARRAKQGAVHDVAGVRMCFFREVQSDVRRSFFGAVRGGLSRSARHGQRGIAHRITEQARCVRTREAQEGAPQIDAAGGARRVGELGQLWRTRTLHRLARRVGASSEPSWGLMCPSSSFWPYRRPATYRSSHSVSCACVSLCRCSHPACFSPRAATCDGSRTRVMAGSQGPLLQVEATKGGRGPRPGGGHLIEAQQGEQAADVGWRRAGVGEEECAPQGRAVQIAIGVCAQPRREGGEHGEAGAEIAARGILQGGVLGEHGEEGERGARTCVCPRRGAHEVRRGQQHGGDEGAVELVIEALEARERRVGRQGRGRTQRPQPRVPKDGALGRGALARDAQRDPAEQAAARDEVLRDMGYRGGGEHHVFELLSEAVVRRGGGRQHRAVHAEHEVPYVPPLEHGPFRAGALQAARVRRVGDAGVRLPGVVQEAQDPCALCGPRVVRGVQRSVQHRHIEHVEARPLQEVAAHVGEGAGVRRRHEAQGVGGEHGRHGRQPRHLVVRAGDGRGRRGRQGVADALEDEQHELLFTKRRRLQRRVHLAEHTHRVQTQGGAVRREARHDAAHGARAQDREPFEAGQVGVVRLALEDRAADEVEHEPRVVRRRRQQRQERREARCQRQRRRHGLLVGGPRRGPRAVSRAALQDGPQRRIAGIGRAAVQVHEARERRGRRERVALHETHEQRDARPSERGRVRRRIHHVRLRDERVQQALSDAATQRARARDGEREAYRVCVGSAVVHDRLQHRLRERRRHAAHDAPQRARPCDGPRRVVRILGHAARQEAQAHVDERRVQPVAAARVHEPCDMRRTKRRERGASQRRVQCRVPRRRVQRVRRRDRRTRQWIVQARRHERRDRRRRTRMRPFERRERRVRSPRPRRRRARRRIHRPSRRRVAQDGQRARHVRPRVRKRRERAMRRGRKRIEARRERRVQHGVEHVAGGVRGTLHERRHVRVQHAQRLGASVRDELRESLQLRLTRLGGRWPRTQQGHEMRLRRVRRESRERREPRRRRSRGALDDDIDDAAQETRARHRAQERDEADEVRRVLRLQPRARRRMLPHARLERRRERMARRPPIQRIPRARHEVRRVRGMHALKPHLEHERRIVRAQRVGHMRVRRGPALQDGMRHRARRHHTRRVHPRGDRVADAMRERAQRTRRTAVAQQLDTQPRHVRDDALRLRVGPQALREADLSLLPHDREERAHRRMLADQLAYALGVAVRRAHTPHEAVVPERQHVRVVVERHEPRIQLSGIVRQHRRAPEPVPQQRRTLRTQRRRRSRVRHEDKVRVRAPRMRRPRRRHFAQHVDGRRHEHAQDVHLRHALPMQSRRRRIQERSRQQGARIPVRVERRAGQRLHVQRQHTQRRLALHRTGLVHERRNQLDRGKTRAPRKLQRREAPRPRPIGPFLGRLRGLRRRATERTHALEHAGTHRARHILQQRVARRECLGNGAAHRLRRRVRENRSARRRQRAERRHRQLQHTSDVRPVHVARRLIRTHVDHRARQHRAHELRTRLADTQRQLLLPQIIRHIQLAHQMQEHLVV